VVVFLKIDFDEGVSFKASSSDFIAPYLVIFKSFLLSLNVTFVITTLSFNSFLKIEFL
jgi:hypothetical protein